MKKIIILICVLLLTGTAWAVSLIGSGIDGDECDGALVCQNFEGTGYDNGESWTAESSCDPDYDGSNVLRGDQALEMSYDNSAPDAYVDFTGTSEVWAHAMWQATYIGTAVVPIIEILNSDGSEVIFSVNVSTSKFALFCGTEYVSYTATISTDTEYHIWLHLDGVDQEGELYIGTSATRPASPVASVTNGDNTDSSMARFNVTGSSYADSSDYGYFDQVVVMATEFTSVGD